MADDKIDFTYSCVVPKKGKPFVSVMFERGGDRAEGSVPDCSISKNKGFSQDEVKQLEQYLRENKQEIMENAKRITGIGFWF